MSHAFTTNKRERLTDQQKAALFLERGGRCHRCLRKLRAGDAWIAEHLNALQNGGGNEWGNWGVTCAWCFPDKNRDDAKLAAKGRARATKHVVPRSEMSGKSRPMPGSRRSQFKVRLTSHGRKIERRNA